MRADDAYVQGTATLTTAISGTTGGNYEALNTTSTTSTNVVDDTDATTVTLTASANSVSEGGSIIYTATVNNPVTGSNLVITLNNGQTITIPVGQSSASSTAFSVRADDMYAQGTATLTTAISGTTGGNYEALTTTSTTSTSVVDDTDATTVSITGSASVTEGGVASYTVALTSAAQTAVTIILTYSGTAANGSDFTGVATVNIPAGSSSANFNITTIDDSLNEALENFTVTISSATGGNFENLVVSGTNNSVITAIVDNDPTPSLSIGDVTVDEAAGTATFTVTLSAASGQTVTVGYNTSDSSATAGADYVSGSGTLTFAPGNTTQTITINITEDAIDEPNETFFVNLETPTNATILDGLGVGTIIDNDAAPTISSVTAASSIEGASLVHTVALSNASSVATTFAFTLGGGTATSGIDYNAPTFSNGVTYSAITGLVTVPAGVTSFDVTVATINDTIYEGVYETYNLTVGGVTGVVGTITDNDAAPTISSVTAATQTEGVSLVHTVNLSSAASVATTHSFSLGGGTATSGTDYTSPPTFSNGVTLSGGNLTVPAGVTSFTVTIPTTNDVIDEGLSETYNLIVGGVTAVGTILDNDTPPTINSVTAASAIEGLGITHTVTLSAITGAPITYAFSLGGGTATAVSDYAAPTFSAGVTYDAGTGLVTVPAGVTSFTVTIPTTGDTIDEVNETYNLTVGGVTAVGTITDNDAAPTISSVTADMETEGTSLVHTLTLSNASSVATTFAYTLVGGTATAGTDYTATPIFSNGVTLAGGNLTVPAGVTSFTVTIPTTQDTIYEGASETYTLTVGGIANTGTIADDDAAPTLSVSDITVIEVDNLNAVFAVALSNPSSTAVTVTLSFGGGTATGGSANNPNSASTQDYGNNTRMQVSTDGGVSWSALGTNTITFAPGATSALVRTAINSNNDITNETFDLTATVTSGTTLNPSAVGTATILEQSVAVNSVSSPTVTEGGTLTYAVVVGTHLGVVETTLELSGTASVADYGSLAFTGGVTYDAGTGLITIPAGITNFNVTLLTINDNIDEPAETVLVTIGGVIGTGTITDNDPTPTISSVTIDTKTEGVDLVHTVTLSNPSSVATTFAFTLGGGTATAGTDYNVTPTFSNGVTLAGGNLTVPAGVTSFIMTVPTIDNALNEATETYNISVGGVSAVGTITDNDATPTLSINDVTVDEAAGTASFTVTLSAASGRTVTVGYNTSNGTATAGTDYSNSTGTLTFAPGTTTQTITVPITNDTLYEGVVGETFNVNLVTPTNATILDALGVGTITDNDAAPTITSVTAATQTEGTSLVHTVTLSAAPGGPATYAFTLGGGTATAGTDYTSALVNANFSGGVTYSAITGLVTVPAGVASFTVTVPTVNDTLDEGVSETYNLTVGGVNAVGTINDDDAPPTLSINDVTVNEAAGTASFTVTLSTASGLPVTVNYGMTSQTALSGVDFISGAGTLTFAPGITTQTITVPILNDNLYEVSEAFKVTLSAATNATIADAMGIGTILDDGTGSGGSDNDAPTFAVSSVTVSDSVVGGYANFIVSLSNPSSVATTFNLALLASGTATGGGGDYGAVGATNLQVSTNNGVTWVNATSVTIPINATYVLVRTPITSDSISEGSETFTLTATRTSGATTNASAVGIGTITDVNNAPDAVNNANSIQPVEDAPTTTLTGNAILGATDPNNDTLSITGAVAGTGAVVGVATLSAPLTVSGIYGTLVINADGSYTYTLDNTRIQTQNIINNQNLNDVFTYKITDGNGGYDTATITVTVTGTQDLTAILPQSVAISSDGLMGEYYGYNDATVAGNRVHADDRTATTLGTGTNLESVEDIEKIINGRNVLMGGPNNVVGTASAGAVDAADVRFAVRTLNYGTTPVVSGSLGGNAAQAAGAALLPQDNVVGSTTRALANFLDQDSSTAIVQTGTPSGGSVVGVNTGLGKTTDAIIRMTGFVYLERGNYDFRVTADDGFRLKVGGETLLEFDGNQPPTTRTFNNVEVSDLISGLTSIELLYWEQGGNANLQFEFKLSSSATFIPFSLDSIAFFSAANVPAITDSRIQDIVETSVNQQYELRTGSVLDGDAGANTLTGGIGRDYMMGFGGNDTLNGNAGADFLDGGDGDDTLNGGDGNDILIGGAGTDSMTGGLGDDIYRIDRASDVMIEAAGQGTDTIEIDASYNPGTHTIALNFENVLVNGSFNVNVTGNAAANRITGNDGSNTLSGLGGDDRLLGGKGNDILTGGANNDIFEWNLADKGSLGVPAIDQITDFVYTGNATGTTARTDALDLRDLLVGEQSTELNTGVTPNIGNLLEYLNFQVAGGTTTINISSTGGFAGGNYIAGAEDQRIVLNGVNLYNVTGAANGNETDLLQRLLANGSLVVD